MTSTQLAFPPESPFGRAVLPLIALTVGLLYALTRAAGTPEFLTAFFGIVGVAYLPGLGAALWVENRFGLWSSWILPLVLSPVLAVGAGLLLVLSGVDIQGASSWIVFLAVLVTALAPQPRRELEDYAVSMEMPGFLRRRSDRQQVIGLAVLVLAVIAAPLLLDAWVRGIGPAVFRLGVVRDILTHGIPPRDPLLAGIPYRGFWAFDAYLALLEGATRLDLGALLAGGSLVAAFVLVFTGYRLLNLLALSHARSLWGATFLFFSLNGAFWLTLPGAGLARAGGGGLGPFLQQVLRLPPDPAAGFPPLTTFFLERFLVAGPFVMALVYLSLFLMAIVTTLGEERVRWNLLAFVAAVGMLLFHGGVGLVAIAVTVLSIPVIWIAGRLNPFRGPGWELTGTLLPMALALLVAAPYLAHLLRGAPLDLRRFLDPSLPKALLFLGLLLPDLLFGAGVLAAFLAAPEVRRQAWTVWTVLLAAICLAVDFPGPHPVMAPLVLAHVPLSLAAGASVPYWWQRLGRGGRVLLAALLFVILVPRTALGVAAYLHAPDPRDRRPEAQEVVSFLREKTPMDAIVVDGLPDLAQAAERAVLYGPEDHVEALGYQGNAVVTRKLAAYNLIRGAELHPHQRAVLLDLERPVYVVERFPKPDALGPPPHGERVFANDRFAVYLWAPSAERDEP